MVWVAWAIQEAAVVPDISVGAATRPALNPGEDRSLGNVAPLLSLNTICC